MTIHQLVRTMAGRVPRSSRAFSAAATTMMGRTSRASSAQLAPSLILRQGAAVTSNQSHDGALPGVTTTKRLFSSSSADDLSSLLARELAEEEEDGALEMPEELVELKEELAKDWTILDDVESGTVKMFSKSGRVSVVFHCQDTLDVEFDDDADDEDEASPEVRFTLTVQKAGRTMVMNCVSVEANAVIETVAVTMEDVEAIHVSGKVSDKLYQGPQFDELAEDLQEAFTAFVQTECGIHTNVAAFISMYADFKEQEEYFRWLKQVQGIID